MRITWDTYGLGGVRCDSCRARSGTLASNLARMWISNLAHVYPSLLPSRSMIIDDLHVDRVPRSPSKANAPLLVDADAHLSGAVSLQNLEPITRRVPQILQCCRSMELPQSAKRPILNVPRKFPTRLPLPDALRLVTSERSDHGLAFDIVQYQLRIKYKKLHKASFARVIFCFRAVKLWLM